MYKGQLKRIFYTASSPECRPGNRIFKPSVAFEIFNKVAGFAEYYDFPNEMDPNAYENSFREKFIESRDHKRKQDLREEWESLQALNPQLRSVRPNPNSGHELQWAIVGVASLYRPEDISFFIESQRSGNGRGIYYEMMQKPDYAFKMNAVQRRCNISGWVPSPATLDRMYKAVRPGV